MTSSVDHLVVSGTDLLALVAWWRERAGTFAVTGGSHDGLGTRNALVGLGGTSYLELIGPDPEQGEPAQPRPFGIDDLPEYSIALSTFALAVEDLDAATAAVRAAGIDPGPIRPMARTRPDGVHLSWRLAVPPAKSLGGAMPFLIEWGPETPHPTSSLEHECKLNGISVTHPEPGPIQAALATLDLAGSVEVTVAEGRRPGLAAVVATPNGSISLP